MDRQAFACLLLLGRRRAMDDKIIKITQRQMDDKSAEILKKKQERTAAHMKSDQTWDAASLIEAQMKNPETDMLVSAEKAATALKDSQEEAAAALKLSQQEGAQMLQNANDRSSERLKEKNNIINHLTGQYSIQPDDEE